jgi:hypothetical protein
MKRREKIEKMIRSFKYLSPVHQQSILAMVKYRKIHATLENFCSMKNSGLNYSTNL